MTISVNVVGKLPAGLIELYGIVDGIAQKAGIEYFIIGAMARDLVLHHGFGATLERGTRDVDFAIQVASWDEFKILKNNLLQLGFTADNKLDYRLWFSDLSSLPWEIDILPFGGVVDEHYDVSLPPKSDFKMSVLGFYEALETAWLATISNDPLCVIKVANPAAIIVLKMIAWTERDISLRRKDAVDIGYIVKSYHCIPSVFERLYADGFMASNDWDTELASAMLLGNEIAQTLCPETRAYLNECFINNKSMRTTFIRDFDARNAESLLDKLILNH